MKFFTIAILSFVLLFSLVPHAYAVNIWEGAMCGGSTAIGSNGGPPGACSFCDMFIVARNILTFLTEAAVLLAVASIVWGALRMITAGGDPGAIKKAREGITKSVTGLAVVLVAWTIMSAFLIFIARGTASGNTANWKWYEIKCTQ